VVRGFDQHGEAFQEFCFLKNLSPTGACLGQRRSLAIGATVEMDVCTPLSRKQWLRYFGKVIHVGHLTRPQATGIRFDSARPAFFPTAAVVCLRLIKGQSRILH
jgi:phosphohistidine phosphatase SixA